MKGVNSRTSFPLSMSLLMINFSPLSCAMDDSGMVRETFPDNWKCLKALETGQDLFLTITSGHKNLRI